MSESRNCANLCGRAFFPPEKDPDRTMCTECLREFGIPRIRPFVPEEDRPIELPTGVCGQCGERFVKVGDESRCSVCRNLVHTTEDESPLPPEVLEVDARPDPAREGLPLHRRLSKHDALEYAAELAADMVTGYYIPAGETKPWPEGKFTIREILTRMGYGEWYVKDNRKPKWWPEGGTAAFKGYVDWKVQERRMIGRVAHDRLIPYIEAATFMGFTEMVKRIKLDPEKVPFRDLSQFVMRGVEAIKNQADPWSGKMTVEGANAYAAIAKALDGVEDPTARKALEAMLGTALDEARGNLRKVVEVPARTA